MNHNHINSIVFQTLRKKSSVYKCVTHLLFYFFVGTVDTLTDLQVASVDKK